MCAHGWAGYIGDLIVFISTHVSMPLAYLPCVRVQRKKRHPGLKVFFDAMSLTAAAAKTVRILSTVNANQLRDSDACV